MSIRLRLFATLGALCAAVGCGPSSPCSDTSQTTFAQLKTTVFGSGPQTMPCPSCTPRACSFNACHESSTPQANLDLITDPYNSLVGVAPTDVAARAMFGSRVTPGDTAKSYLYYKVSLGSVSDPACTKTCQPPGCCLGNRMPNTNQSLDQCSIQMVGDWIKRGAPND